MKNHKLTDEQYCFVQGGNVVFEETVYHNGERSRRCSRYEDCRRAGGCKNTALNAEIGENAVDGTVGF